EAVASGIPARFPAASWHTLSVAPERAIDEAVQVLLVATFGLLALLWVRLACRPRQDEGALLLVAGLLVGSGLLHYLAEAEAAFGVLARNSRHRAMLPIVSMNHFGALVALLLPTVIGVAADRRSRPITALA